jgi:hypothetical protein
MYLCVLVHHETKTLRERLLKGLRYRQASAREEERGEGERASEQKRERDRANNQKNESNMNKSMATT